MKIRLWAIVAVCGLMAACSSWFEKTIHFDTPSQQIAFKQGAFTTFDNQTYQFSYGTPTLNEYIPRGEVINNWKNILSIEQFPEADDVREPLNHMIEDLVKRKVVYQVLENKALKMTSVNFVEEKWGYKELNVWKFKKNEKTRGVVGYRYAKKFNNNDLNAYQDFTQNKDQYVTKFLSAPTVPFIH